MYYINFVNNYQLRVLNVSKLVHTHIAVIAKLFNVAGQLTKIQFTGVSTRAITAT